MLLLVSQVFNQAKIFSTLAGVHSNLSLGAPRGVVTHFVQKFGCLSGIGRVWREVFFFLKCFFFLKTLWQGVNEIFPSHFGVCVAPVHIDVNPPFRVSQI